MMGRAKRAAFLTAAAVWTAGILSGCAGGDYQPIEIQTQEAAGGEHIPNTLPQAETSLKETAVSMETAPAYQTADDTVYITGDRVNIRKEGSTSGQIVGRLDKGAALKRTGIGGSWSRVIYQDQECYVSNQYIAAKPAETAAAEAENAAQAKDSPLSSAQKQEIRLNPDWQYAGMSKINSGTAVLYKAENNRKGIVVCVNAGHGTQGGGSVKTLCHPDGTPKVTSGTTQAGATTAAAVSSGMTFADGTPEHQVTLSMALKLKEKLLADGYDVLMIRETEDVQLDNVARTVIANNAADCHIALHWDSTSNDKGAFYMSVPSNETYRNMEPVKSHWQQHNALGESLVAGLKSAGVKIFSGGSMEMDLTQTSYSTIPSVDIELGDKASDHSSAALDTLVTGLLAGIDQYFGQ